ncbi:MAG: HPr family phosphocarrier protein [Candidatus Krumholzibacteriota bacterium]|nr:HPr family phosphocarrier protein [Candidatus Krumholzibacteriota bacterium]
MISGKVKVTNKRGIHLRLAGELVKMASRFKSEVMIGKDEDLMNAKSILGVAGLGAEFGTELLLNVDGVDEKEALDTLIDLIDNKFYMEE